MLVTVGHICCNISDKWNPHQFNASLAANCSAWIDINLYHENGILLINQKLQTAIYAEAI